LQEREIQPLGSTRTVKLDVRVIAATNKNLKEEVAAGRFREDLYFRLRVLFIEIPPLKDRKEDIPLLVDHLVERLSLRTGKRIRGVDAEVMELLMAYSYPGNVRELENILEHAFVMCEEDSIGIRHLPPDLLEHGVGATPRPARSGGDSSLLSRAEAKAIQEALDSTGGNRSEAARLLGISRTTLWRKMRKLGL
jgi:transcriptional regulator with PAS, ATPase and Fis domain